MPQIPSLYYSASEDTVLVNLYGSSETELKLGDRQVNLTQTSEYPWDGKVRLEIELEHSNADKEFTIALRIPGWLKQPFPSDLYRYADSVSAEQTMRRLAINGRKSSGELKNGYEYLKRSWKSGDVIEIDFPMPVRKVVANEKVASCRNRMAIARGPIVFAVEGHDNDGKVHSLVINDLSEFVASPAPDLLGGIVTLTGNVQSISGDRRETDHEATLIPYYAWAHRGRSPLRVWLATKPAIAWPHGQSNLAYSKAKIAVSGKNRWTQTAAVNDQILPTSSDDDETPRFLWDKTNAAPMGAGELEGDVKAGDLAKGVRWIQYDFAEPVEVSSSSIYWVVGNFGRWALPKNYRLLVRQKGKWKKVDVEMPVAKKDSLQTINFDPVVAESVRLEVVPQKNQTAGLLEWTVQ